MTHSMADMKSMNLRLFLQKLNDRFGFQSSRRKFFLIIFGATIVFYLLSKLTKQRVTFKNVEYDQCLERKLNEFSKDVNDMNIILNHEPIQHGESFSLPFSGNGFLGLSLSTRSYVQLISDVRIPFISTGYSPVIEISSNIWEDSKATIIQMNQGLVKRIHCFKINEKHSTYVTHLLYVHRIRPSLIVQQIDIVNPSEQTFDLEIEQRKQTFGNNVKELDRQEIQFDSSNEKYFMITNQLSMRSDYSLIFVLITQKSIRQFNVKSDSQDKQTIFTIIKFSSLFSNDLLNNKTYVKQWKNNLQEQAKADLIDVLSISTTNLLNEHLKTWSSIWKSGFSISRSLAPSIINGDVINRTIYYVLCSTVSPLYDPKLDTTLRNEYNQSLFQIDQCYESHSTLLGNRLWSAPGDDLAVSQLSLLWRSTLSKKGCLHLMKSGVNGVLQSMLLSIGGMRFRYNHLEINLDPKELHRDMVFRLIHFGKQFYLNITISVEHDNRAVINVSIDNENSHVYACDAGCLDPPTKLNSKPTRFPVKMTNPSTAILYVTEDFQYISQLKEILHVKEIDIAPPHGHDILALHRHGHKLGGLPIIFWIALTFLIIIFHLFLLKIVLNEMGFFKQNLPIYSRSHVR